MALPTPCAGLIVHDRFLWAEEADARLDAGRKHRPCLILTARKMEGGTRVVVFPITHIEPEPPDKGIEIPPDVAHKAGLDADRQWVILDQLNYFMWPGYDLAKIPGTGRHDYGMMPEGFFEKVRHAVAERRRNEDKSIRQIMRD